MYLLPLFKVTALSKGIEVTLRDPVLEILPPIRTADLSASCILIISPGTKKEEFKELLKLTTSL